MVVSEDSSSTAQRTVQDMGGGVSKFAQHL